MKVLPTVQSDTIEKRKCGSCTACCTYFPIKSLDKKALTPCKHLAKVTGEGLTGCSSGKNCMIYGEYPVVCRDYDCMWLRGYGGEEDRPDKCGMMVDTMLPVKNALRGVPLRAGAQDTTDGIRAVERISRESNIPVMVCKFPETKLLRIVGRGIE